MRGNTVPIEVELKRGKVAKTIALYQYDYGQKLIFTNVDLPPYYEVHFSNQMHGEAITSIGDETGVEIPDDFLATGLPVYLWLFLHAGSSDGETEYQGVIPVIKRASISDQEPTPTQQTAIEQAIVALNTAIESSDASDAEAWAIGKRGTEDVSSDDETYQNNSKYYATQASGSATSAGTSATSAGTDALKAEGYAVGKQNGEDVASGSTYYENNAKYFATQAGNSATSASGSASAADGSAEDAEAYAVGKRDGVDVTSGDPAYQNNSKYYAEEAADSALEATTAAASASAAYGTALLAPNYSSSSTYAVGDHVIYSGNYYECNTAITSGEAWTAAHWTQLTVGGEASALKSAIDIISNNLEGKILWDETAVSLLMQILSKAVYSEDVSAKIESLEDELEYEPITGHTVTYNLTGITSSNTNTNVADGGSYTTTLTATDQTKQVGAITVTMGGTNISSTAVSNNVVTVSSVTGDLVITCSAVETETLTPVISNGPDLTTFAYSTNTYAYSLVYEAGSIKGGVLKATFDKTIASKFNLGIYVFDSNGDPYEMTPYKSPENIDASGNWNPYWVSPGGSGYPSVADSISVQLPSGCYAIVFIRPGTSLVCDGVTVTGANATFREWAKNGGVTVTVEG